MALLPPTLFVIEMGSNDIRDALVAFARRQWQRDHPGCGYLDRRPYRCALRRGSTAIPRLARTQRRLTPAIRALDTISPGAAHLATLLTQGFNGGLDGAVAQLSGLPGISITRLDADRILTNLVTNPPAFGLTDVTTACVTPNLAPFACQQPDEFLFWDGIHPSRAVHAIIAQEAAAALDR